MSLMTMPARRFAAPLAALALLALLAGCVVQPRRAPQRQEGPQPQVEATVAQQARERPPVNTRVNLYEGSLWRGSASWGNLMRDHRARFRGDLLTVRELNRIISVPDIITEPEEPVAAEEEQQQQPQDPIIRFLEEQRKRREEIEQEQAEILRTIDQVEVQVLRVLPNGNMYVRGTHPPIYRDNNRVKYLFHIQGIVRPRDVDDDNSILSSKVSKAEYKLNRLVRRSAIPQVAGSVARAAGERRTGALLDRFTDFLTTPSGGSVGTQQ